MFRIKSTNASLSNSSSPAVLLQHGLFSNADTWIVHYPKSAPAFVLANAGYDVWLGNNRGNNYNQKHLLYDPLNRKQDRQKFFNYSFQELGEFDLPAQVEKVINVTGRNSITFIGHSQGTAQMFAALTQKEEQFYKDRINLFVALAPVTYLDHVHDDALAIFAKLTSVQTSVYSYYGIYELFGRTWNNVASPSSWFCFFLKFICNLQNSVYSSASQYNDASRTDFSNGRPLPGASTKQILHFQQLIKNYDGLFNAYDEGYQGNMQRYGQSKPPVFDLSKIKSVPIAMYICEQDELATIEDANLTYHVINSPIKYYKLLKNCDHSSFMLGKNMSYLNDVLSLMIQFNNVSLSYNYYPGFYMTMNSLSVIRTINNNQNFNSSTNIRYCYSQDGSACYNDQGTSCNQSNGFFCPFQNRQIIDQINGTYCISQNNHTCYQDQGALCNAQNQYECQISNDTQKCFTSDGLNCYHNYKGFCYTFDGYNCIQDQQSDMSKQGSYCWSNNGLTCSDYTQYKPQCGSLDYYFCQCGSSNSNYCNYASVQDKTQGKFCITNDNSTCHQDYGQLCNNSQDLRSCFIDFRQQNTCWTYDGLNCFDLQTQIQYQYYPGYYMTFNGLSIIRNINDIQNFGNSSINASYCYSQDGSTCYQDQGISCNQSNGFFCPFENRSVIDQINGTYCISQNNQTCFQDQGALCNAQNQYECQISNDSQKCFTSDGLNCYLNYKGFCYTFDGYNCIQDQLSDMSKQGTYCWSNNGLTCSDYTQYKPQCGSLDYYFCQCGSSNSNYCNYATVQDKTQGKFCITNDNSTCHQDYGQLCNNSYDLRSCFIDFRQQNTCWTYDGQNCFNLLKSNYQSFEQQIRNQVRQFFNYSIEQNLNDASVPNQCRNCSFNNNSCCSSVNLTTYLYGSYNIDNFCMDKNIASNFSSFQLSDFTFTIECMPQILLNQFAYLSLYKSKLLSAFILVTFIQFA